MDSALHSPKRNSESVVWTSNALYGSPLPRLKDFEELFSFSSSTSIPVLDLAPSARNDLDTRAPSSAFEYDDVFASSRSDDSALSYHELINLLPDYADVASHSEKDDFPARVDLASSAVFDAAEEDPKKPMICTMIADDCKLERETFSEVNDAVAVSDERWKISSETKETSRESVEKNLKAACRERKREQEEKEDDVIPLGEERAAGKSVKARIAAFEQRFKKKEVNSSFRRDEGDDKNESFKAKQKTLIEEQQIKDDIIFELVEDEDEQGNVKKKESAFSQEDEPPMRIQARLQRHKRVSDRTARALAEKTKFDLIEEKEAEERERVAEAVDAEVKRWSSGKEGNIRALLSTLQYIVGADGGWQAVSLTDIVSAATVKKAYKKATLCLHPDKLQQRGASVQQKCTSEKVFDLLKNAWTIFNSEEW